MRTLWKLPEGARNDHAKRIHHGQASRPRPGIPAATPRKTNRSRAPIEGDVHEVLAYDRNGRRTVSLERKTKGGVVIENREQSAASVARNQRIKGAKA